MSVAGKITQPANLGNPIYQGSMINKFVGGNINRAGVAGRCFLWPFIFEVQRVISQLHVEISVPSAGNNIRLGLYSDGGRKPDGGALLTGADSGDISVAAANVKVYTLSTPVSVKGVIWACLETQDAVMNYLGVNNSNIAISEQAGEKLLGAHFDQAYGALPLTCPATVADALAPVVGGIRVIS